MRRPLAAALILLPGAALGQVYCNGGPCPGAAGSSDFAGSVTLAQLATMAPGSYAGMRVFVTDRGGGPGPVISTGTCWQRLGDAAQQVFPAAATVSPRALYDSPMVALANQASLLNSVTVSFTGYCPGDTVEVYVPSGILTTSGALGVQVNGGNVLSATGIVAPYSARYKWTGSSVVKISGGPIQ